MKPMSLSCRKGFRAPMEAMMLAELGCTGHRETSWFQGLSGGNICKAARILSATGVSNITGAVIGGTAAWVGLPGRRVRLAAQFPTARIPRCQRHLGRRQARLAHHDAFRRRDVRQMPRRHQHYYRRCSCPRNILRPMLSVAVTDGSRIQPPRHQLPRLRGRCAGFLRARRAQLFRPLEVFVAQSGDQLQGFAQ